MIDLFLFTIYFLKMNSMRPGIYQHYKGQYYKVFGTCKHSESGEIFVYYQALYENYEYWVRPLDMFLENVEWNGENIQRFKFVENIN